MNDFLDCTCTVITASVRTLKNNYFGGCTNIYDTKK